MNVFSQTDSLEVHDIKGKKYYIHIIEKGESLYAIHKKYDIPLDVLKKENPSVVDGLSIGGKIFIPVKRKENEEVVLDGNFITHVVQKKQTLYSISKLYKVQQNEIISVNPDITNGLQEGQVIKIPVKKLKVEVKDVKDVPIVLNRKTHVVAKGETLYSLSKTYDISLEEIKQVNNGLPQGLREGETILLPTPLSVIENDTTAISFNLPENLQLDTFSIQKKSIYNIGLLLPFYLDENDEMVDSRQALEERKIYPKSKFAIEFYNGFMAALDSLYSDSCKFKVFVYDTRGKDTSRIKMLLQKPIFKDLNIIVGPLYYDNFELVASYCKENKIPLVTPVKQANKVLLGNPFVFKAIPSKTAIIEPIAKLLVDSFKTENLLAISYKKAKENPLVDLCISAYNKELLSNSDTSIYSSIKKIDVTTNIADIVAQFSGTKNNVIFAPTTSQIEVTSLFSYLITTLNKRDYKNYKVTIIGLEEWDEFENIDMDYFQRLNVHYCSSQYINCQDSLNNQFLTNYINDKGVYPSDYTLLGFDIAYYFGDYFNNYGVNISSGMLPRYYGKSIQFNFFKTGIESGYENKDLSLLRFYDYSIDKVR
ncbi:MAG: LysM peptidoglycan-binding domain-containing protein [Vicingaceae bacterium]|nr:LysM peptidoglycan-binding domain-containing protein [Vicingaceae bacterium]